MNRIRNGIATFFNQPKYYASTTFALAGIATACFMLGNGENFPIVGGVTAGVGGAIVLLKFKQWHSQFQASKEVRKPYENDDLERPEEASPNSVVASYINMDNSMTSTKEHLKKLQVDCGIVDAKGNVIETSDDESLSHYLAKGYYLFVDVRNGSRLDLGSKPLRDLMNSEIKVYNNKDHQLSDSEKAAISNQTIKELTDQGYRVLCIMKHFR